MAAWPGYAKVVAGRYRVRSSPSTRRSSFDDGAARQARIYTAAFTVREIEVLLDSDADRLRFRTWAEDHAHEWFEWHDPEDGVARRARVVGGDGGIEYRAVVDSDRSRRWEARMQLEGLWADTVST